MTRGAVRSASRGRWIVIVILLGVALVLRLGVIAGRDPHDWLAGGDGPWYVLQGWFIAHRALPRTLSSVGPLYPLALAGVWRAFPGHPEPSAPRAIPSPYLGTVRTLQTLVAVLTVALAMALTRQLVADPRAALVTGVGIGLGPAFVIEPFMLHTETLFMALLTAALLAYVAGAAAPRAGRLALSGFLLGLATLTRPVLWLAPLVLAMLPPLRHGARRGLRPAGALALAFVLTVLPWHAYLYRGTGSWRPEGFGANLLSGASDDGRPMSRAALREVERTMPGEQTAAAFRRIAADPLHWARLRARRVLEAVLQPHGTTELGDASVRQAGARWLREDRSLAGAGVIVATPAFPAKVAIYAFHYAALVLAAIGLWASRRRWRDWLPVYLVVGYLVLVYGALTVVPRYLFPAMMFLWVLAGLGLTWARPPGAPRRARF